MRKMKNWQKILVMVPTLFLLFSCNRITNDSRSDSVLHVIRVTGMDIEDNEVDFLQSDVAVFNPETLTTTVAADAAKVTFTVASLDPAPWLGTSQYYDILVTHYVVTYSRSDGKNQEGIDVPYSFDGSLSARVPVDGQTEISFVVVRAVSKLEPPLINLATGRGEGELKTTARIEFYGQDTVGNKVKATGYLTIFFADYITKDEEASPEGGN
ncbi:MAG: hypothetical protein JSV17_12810 [Candidatus Aminicenantes bacterium]|nr:MAG: hypothetical protein JSV17_12810 [Candidatus Aminicenantes bacterium]